MVPGTEKETEVWIPDAGSIGKEFKGKAKDILEAIKDVELRPGFVVDGKILNENHMNQKKVRKGEMVYPNVVEPSFGLDRILYCLLESSWNVEDEREWISLPQDTSPYDLLVAPLMTKDGLDDSAKVIFAKAQEQGIDAYYDEAGSIGRRYARADEVGVPWAVTIDHESLQNGSVTIRRRDDGKQVRIQSEDLVDTLTIGPSANLF